MKIDGMNVKIVIEQHYCALSNDAYDDLCKAVRMGVDNNLEYLHNCVCADFWDEDFAFEFLEEYKQRIDNSEIIKWACYHIEDEYAYLLVAYGHRNLMSEDSIILRSYKVDDPRSGLEYYSDDPYLE